ncbi:MAG: tRNA guanosine(34) transglycosylase Tgt [bacterium]|nr:tRNA guanosine(34) transglycosylase Tgt [bacterium]MCY4162644.1 tRNA guanosine(34) transglycosylase Tgt [bacterium]MCY4258300.1 tRNA guanosine(34) transglycosylase Tgt [bacterium]
MSLTFEVLAQQGAARVGRITTPRGSFATPCFMPVGTRAAVRTLDTADLEALGPAVVLANTYHLFMRPGAELVQKMGGIHGFVGWSGHVLTDSGGYQVFSLSPQVDDEGVTFRSTYDGSTHRFSAETVVDTQLQLGSDIQMVLDVCPPADAPDATQRLAVERTAAWAKRARHRFLDVDGHGSGANQFGIVQGGLSAALRAESAERTIAIGFDGYAVGGLSVGEEQSQMLAALEATTPKLPVQQPRYFMGLGDPVGLIEAIATGVDMFDCVLPTRLARHGTALTWQGRLNLSNAAHAHADMAVDPEFPASPIARYSRAYLRHLYNVDEPSAARLLTLHNLAWLLALMQDAQAAIGAGTFGLLRAKVAAAWGG